MSLEINRKWNSGVLTLLLLHVPFVAAQVSSKQGPKTLEELWEQLDNLDVKITIASRRIESVADAPSSVTVITRNEIRNMGVQTLEELLNYVPGYFVVREVENGAQGFITARNARTGFSNTVLILVDGIRLNASHSGEATLAARLIRLDNVKQVEVIRGPGSALYGGNAFMGVINIVTEMRANEAFFGLGSYNNKEAALHFSGANGNFEYAAFAGYFADDGQEYQGLKDVEGRISHTSDPKEGSHFQFRLAYRNLHINMLHQDRDFEDYYQFRLLGNGVNRDQSTFSAVRLEYQVLGDDSGHQLQINAGASEWNWEAVALLAPSGTGPFQQGDYIGGPQIENFDRNLGIDYLHRFGKHAITAGASYRETGDSEAESLFNYDFEANYLGSVQPIETFNRTDFTRKVLGLWIQDQFEIGSIANLTLGARWDDYNDVGSSFNPRGAVIFETPYQGFFKLMYGEAFRAPSLSELFNSSPVSVGNPDLEPEKIRTTEVAWHQEIGRFSGSATWFRNEIEDIVTTFDFNPPSPALSFVNSAGAVVEGVELEVYGKIGKNYSLRGGYSHALDEMSPLVPDRTGFLICNFQSDWLNLNMNAHWRSNTDALKDDSSQLLGNAKIQFKAMPQLSIALYARNLFDEDYRVGVLSLQDEGVPERGREWLLSMTLVR